MAINTIKDLKNYVNLSENEEEWDQNGPNTLPLLISDNIIPLLKHDAIRVQFVPQKDENVDTLGTLDPQLEESYTPLKRLVHRYENRAAFLTTDVCFAYCRHCFRRRFSGSMQGPASEDEIRATAEYLKKHTEIKEILLTGGDMFTLSDEKLDLMLSIFKEAREDIIYRLCTRALLSNPDRFTDKLFSIIEKNNHGAPFYLMTQFNHSEEITEKASKVLLRFSKMGIPMMNQCVLLKGVNDNVDEQVRLCNKLLMNRVKPYYLFQGDLVKGTQHMRVSITKGLEIEKEMRKKLSGLAMPNYTIDLPNGGGKVPLSGDYKLELNDGIWSIKTPDDDIRHYPD